MPTIERPRGKEMNTTRQHRTIGRTADPLNSLLEFPGGATLAVISGVEGPSYRPIGAMMAIGPDGKRIGSLSSGCVEGDLELQARSAQDKNAPVEVRYGHGSPFVDIVLPCGGALDILLVPNPDIEVLREASSRHATRQSFALDIDRSTGAMAIVEGQGSPGDTVFRIEFVPDIRFVVFGKGPEASTFASMAQSIGYDVELWSPDAETLAEATAAGCDTKELLRQAYPDTVAADRWTAVLAFFHDHDWEPPILGPALASPAFFVGAQGSRRSALKREFELEKLGVGPDDIARLKGPVGLVRSARDPRTLAVSVLAEVLEVARSEGIAP